jgi:multicomponent Na+:H+ antiporter subunit F
MIVYIAALTAVIVAMGLALVRAYMGPTIFDRILAINMFGTKTVALIGVLSFMLERPDFVDLALVYALMNFIGVIALLRFMKFGNFAETDRERDS